MSTTLAKEWSAKAVEPGRDYFPEINNSAINSMSESTVSVDPGALAANEDSYEAINEIRRDNKQAEVRDELWRQQKGITKSGAVAGGSSSQETAARLRRREREHFQRVMDVMTQVEQQRLAAWRQEQTSFKGMNMTNEELSAFFDRYRRDRDKMLQDMVNNGHIDASEVEDVDAMIIEMMEIHRLEAQYAARGEPIPDELRQRRERLQDKPEYDRVTELISNMTEHKQERQRNINHSEEVNYSDEPTPLNVDGGLSYEQSAESFDNFFFDSDVDYFASAADQVYGASMAHAGNISETFNSCAPMDHALASVADTSLQSAPEQAMHEESHHNMANQTAQIKNQFTV